MASQGVWLRRMMEDCGLEQKAPTIIWCDNMSTITVAKNPMLHGRNFIRNLVAEGVIVSEHCDTNSQVVDILTKLLESQKFLYLKMMLGVIDFQSREGVKVD